MRGTGCRHDPDSSVARSRSGAKGGNCMQLRPKSNDFTSPSVPEFITFMKIQGTVNEQCEKQTARLFFFFSDLFSWPPPAADTWPGVLLRTRRLLLLPRR